MKKRKQHSSVAEMVRDFSSDDAAFVDHFLKRIAARQLVKRLTVLRCRAGLSQRDLAEKLHCTQSKISKLESGKDEDISIGELIRYADAAEHEIRLFFVPKGQTIPDQIEMHIGMIRDL